MEEEPVIQKAPFGDVWKVIYKNKTMIMNQKNLEKFLTEQNAIKEAKLN